MWQKSYIYYSAAGMVMQIMCSFAWATVTCGPNGLCQCYNTSNTDMCYMMKCKNANLTMDQICRSIGDNNDTDITCLDASLNNIRTLNRSSMRGCEKIKGLSVTENGLTDISDDTFVDMPHLGMLDLSNNNMTYMYYDTSRPFLRNITNLKSIRLNGNYQIRSGVRYSYPSIVGLTSIEELAVDGLYDTVFGRDYLSLHSLSRLNMSGSSGYCNVGHLTNDTFENIPGLQTLDLSNCNIKNIYAGTFECLPKLKWMDLSVNRQLRFRVLRNVSYGLQFTKIDFLNYSQTHNTFGLGTILKKRDVCFLRNTTLRILALNFNKIEIWERNTPMLFPKTIQEIYYDGNKPIFGPYVLQAGCFTNITNIYATNQNSRHSPLDEYPNDIHDTDDIVSPVTEECPYMSESYLRNISRSIRNCPYYESDNITLSIPQLPGNLTTIIYSHNQLEYDIPTLLVTNLNNKIENLDFSNNILYSWKGPVGPLPVLKTLNLSRNYCADIHEDFFKYGGSLETLDIRKNYLGNLISNATKGTAVFMNLRNLKYLYAAQNQIRHLPQHIFISLINLEVLELSYNMIETFQVDISTLKNLSYLDLSNNALQTLPENVIRHFDELHDSRGIRFIIDLNNNPIRVSCNERLFLEWMVKRRDLFANFDMYRFIDGSGSMMSLSEFLDTVNNFGKACQSYTVLIIICTLAMSIFLSIVIYGVIYKNRWKLRYFFYRKKRMFKNYQQLQNEALLDNYRYDAFVSYSEDDKDFVRNELIPNLENGDDGLSLCVHERDFAAGNYVADNILDAIESSRNTVVILSKSFVKRKWCLYEFNMARMESIYSRDEKGYLIVVMLENVPAKDMPLEMVQWIKDDCYIEYTTEEAGVALFWKKIRDAVGNNKRV